MSRKGRQKRRMHLESKCVLPDQPESSVLRSIRLQPDTYETCSQDLHRCQARQRDPLPIGAVRQQDPLRSRNRIRVLHLRKPVCPFCRSFMSRSIKQRKRSQASGTEKMHSRDHFLRIQSQSSQAGPHPPLAIAIQITVP